MAWFDLLRLLYQPFCLLEVNGHDEVKSSTGGSEHSWSSYRVIQPGALSPHHVSLLQTLEDLLWRGKQEMTDLSCDFKCRIKSSKGQSVCGGFCSRHSRPRPHRQILVWSHTPSDSGLRTQTQVLLCFSDLWRPEPSSCQGWVPSAVRAAQMDKTVFVCELLPKSSNMIRVNLRRESIYFDEHCESK